MNKLKQPTVFLSLLMTTHSVILMKAAVLSTFLRSRVAAPQGSETIYSMQETAMSRAPSEALPGNLPHAAVYSLVIRNDGMIYTGQDIFSANLSIELEIMHLSSQTKYQIKPIESLLKQF